jgi:hypothetical protein
MDPIVPKPSPFTQFKQSLKESLKDGVISQREGTALFMALTKLEEKAPTETPPLGDTDVWISASGGLQDMVVSLVPHEGKLYVQYASPDFPGVTTFELGDLSPQELDGLIPSAYENVSFAGLEVHRGYVSAEKDYASLDGFLEVDGQRRYANIVARADGSLSVSFGQSWGRAATRFEVETALQAARAGGPKLAGVVEVFEKALALL